MGSNRGRDLVRRLLLLCSGLVGVKGIRVVVGWGRGIIRRDILEVELVVLLVGS